MYTQVLRNAMGMSNFQKKIVNMVYGSMLLALRGGGAVHFQKKALRRFMVRCYKKGFYTAQYPVRRWTAQSALHFCYQRYEEVGMLNFQEKSVKQHINGPILLFYNNMLDFVQGFDHLTIIALHKLSIITIIM